MNIQVLSHPRATTPTDSQIASREVIIANECGLHMRPAAELVRLSRRFKSAIHLIVEGRQFATGQFLDLLRANISQGKRLTVMAQGEDAATALSAVVEFFHRLAREDQNSMCPAPQLRQNSNATYFNGQAA